MLPCLLAGLLLSPLVATTSARAESTEYTTSFTVEPGPLKLHGSTSFRLRFQQEGVEAVAYLPVFAVEDATGSGNGWHVDGTLLGEGALLEAFSFSAPVPRDEEVLPKDIPPAATGLLIGHARGVLAHSPRDRGMGIFTYHHATLFCVCGGILPLGLSLQLGVHTDP